ncbi:MAG: hypothetical protein HPY81_06680 [Firmicutes bacterium]|nr:hypothetical protein [Bacillota bacterium]
MDNVIKPDFPFNLHRVAILTSGFGSGKTEIAINIALAWRTRQPVALVELDVVNPYFCSREARDF